MTAKQESIDELSPKMRKNVEHTLKLNSGLRVRFLSDADCSKFIGENYDADLLSAYEGEKYGAYRGDICRAAVVALEGGFYADLDMEFKVPLSEMVDNATTFMSAFAGDCDILNAVFAAEERSEVMQSVLAAIKTWYQEAKLGLMGPETVKNTQGRLMGPATMAHGLLNVSTRHCPGLNLKDPNRRLQFACGPHHQFRLYNERPLRCQGPKTDDEECYARAEGAWDLMNFGIYEPGTSSSSGRRRNLMAYSRFEGCSNMGCTERIASRASMGCGRSPKNPCNGTFSFRPEFLC